MAGLFTIQEYFLCKFNNATLIDYGQSQITKKEASQIGQMESSLLPSCEATIQGRNIKEPLYEEVKVTGAMEENLTFYITRPVPDDDGHKSTDTATATVASTHGKKNAKYRIQNVAAIY